MFGVDQNLDFLTLERTENTEEPIRTTFRSRSNTNDIYVDNHTNAFTAC